MNIFSAPTRTLLASIFLYVSSTWAINANEKTSSELLQHVAEISQKNFDEQKVVATPQPPLLELPTEQSYEPQAKSEKTAKEVVIEQENNVELTRSIDNTPQPPVVGQSPEQSYGPKNTGTPIKKETPETINDKKMTRKTEFATEKDKQDKKWTETYPVSVNADWLQLKSGEWLRGRITVMQKDELEFDSDELNDLVIKWKNVKYLKSFEPYSLRFDSLGRSAVTGVIEIIGDEVHVTTDYDDKTYSKHDLHTIASGKETEISYWKTKVTFSINARSGNTDQTDFTSKISAKRRTTDSRLVLDYLGNFTEVEKTETINNHRLKGSYDYFITRDFFWTPLFAEFYRDPFQNIEQRLNAGVAIGHSIVNTHTSEWDVSIGPAYQETRFVSVLPGVDEIDSTATLMLGTTFNAELNSKIDLEGLYNLTLGDDETGGYTHHALLTIETELTGKLNFDVTTVWDRVRNPVPDQEGNTPESNDFRIMIGLGYNL